METLRKFYSKKVYNEKTNYMFNALTLKVSDKDMANEIRKRQYQTFNDIYWYCFVGSLISVLYHFGLYVAGTGPLFMVIVGTISFIN
jgi:hypothetical protein